MYKKSALALCAFMTLLFFACKKDNTSLDVVKTLAAPPTIQGTYKLIDEQGEWNFIYRADEKGEVDSIYWTAGYLTTNNGGELTIDANRFYYDSVYYYVDTAIVEKQFHNGVLTFEKHDDRRVGMTVDYHVSAPYTLVSPDSVSLNPGIETISGHIDGFRLSWSGDTLTMFREASTLTDTSYTGGSTYLYDYQSLKRRYVKK
jgi:hypothetical protein